MPVYHSDFATDYMLDFLPLIIDGLLNNYVICSLRNMKKKKGSGLIVKGKYAVLMCFSLSRLLAMLAEQ